MADVAVEVKVESNVDHLNAGAVRNLLERLVKEITHEGTELLRVNVPKDTGRMAEHVAEGDVEQIDDLIRGAFGIRPIDIENQRFQVGTKDLFTPGEQSSRDYPIFVNRGTGIFGPAEAPIHARRAHVMRFDVTEGSIFRSEIKGQRGQEFLLKTYAELRQAILPARVKVFAERVRALAVNASPS